LSKLAGLDAILLRISQPAGGIDQCEIVWRERSDNNNPNAAIRDKCQIEAIHSFPDMRGMMRSRQTMKGLFR
jgi:hypothetical protein